MILKLIISEMFLNEQNLRGRSNQPHDRRAPGKRRHGWQHGRVPGLVLPRRAVQERALQLAALRHQRHRLRHRRLEGKALSFVSDQRGNTMRRAALRQRPRPCSNYFRVKPNFIRVKP